MRPAISVLSPIEHVPSHVSGGGQTNNVVSPRSALSDSAEAAGAHTPAAFSLLLSDIRDLFKVRQHLLRAEKRLFNHIGAIIGWDSDATDDDPDALHDPEEPVDLAAVLGDKWKDSVLGTLRIAHDDLKAKRLWNERQLCKAAKRLPVYPWIKATRGLSELGLGLMVGAGQTEQGSIFNASNPAKVWKRFGLGLVHGERQRRVAGKDKATTALAVEHGYSPSRRSIMHTVGTSMVMSKGVLYPLFIERKDTELAKLIARDGETVKKGQRKHAQMRALRYIEKRILLMLWREWRREVRGVGLAEELPGRVVEEIEEE